jgi:hypothetical protein
MLSPTKTVDAFSATPHLRTLTVSRVFFLQLQNTASDCLNGVMAQAPSLRVSVRPAAVDGVTEMR